MVKHTQTIHWKQPKNCLSVFEIFLGLALFPSKKSLLEMILTQNGYKNLAKILKNKDLKNTHEDVQIY